MALTLLAIATLVLSGKPMLCINPKTDYAFKKIFGSEQSQDILISFFGNACGVMMSAWQQ